MKWLTLIFSLVFVFYGCAKKPAVQPSEGVEEVSILEEEEIVEVPPTEEEVVPPPAEEEAPLVEEEVSPPPPAEEEVTLPPPEEAPPVIEEIPPPPEEVTEAPPPPPPVTPKVEAPRRVLGFRVQIFASSTEKGANKVAADARSTFTEGVYVEYEAPYYKVRVGDCLTKDEASALRTRLVGLGYRGAFIVETQVNLR